MGARSSGREAALQMLFAHEAWHFYVFAVIFGICYGGEMVGFPIINRQMFGRGAPLGSIYSFEMVGASTGMTKKSEPSCRPRS